MEANFTYKNLTCCSVVLCWNYNKKEKDDLYSYKLLQREGSQSVFTDYFKFKEIYKGKDTSYEVINLKPNQTYTFKLLIIENDETIEEKIIEATMLSSPSVVISENSFGIANGEVYGEKEKISDFQTNIIKNCSKLIFDENDENILKGNFNGIKIRIANENNVCYISFDLDSEYSYKFFKEYIKECDANIIIPCHFIIKQLPTILIFNLLEKSSIIFTGKRMGGMIASSLAFYIMYIGKAMKKNFGNAFLKNCNNSIGVVTFGSPTFLNNLTVGFKMKELAPYFYHVKDEFDFIPVVLDFISLSKSDIPENEFHFLNKIELTTREIDSLNQYLKEINFNKDNLNKFINDYIRIPFGYYYMMKRSDFSLISINEYNFKNFYHPKNFDSLNITSHLKIYKKLASSAKFNKKDLEYLESKENQMEFISIIRRNYELTNDKKPTMKAIIKIELTNLSNNNITPDVIEKISLFSSDKREIIVNKEDIYYDNDTDITAYINNFTDNLNINDAIITNHFSGEIKIKYVLNFQGSGPTRKMLYDNLEKIFLIPFFKLFEIFYISFGKEENYNESKEENFGKNFEALKILKPFENQIKILNELLLFTRPDIISNKESKFIEMYINEKEKELTGNKKEVINNIKNNLIKYYKEAKSLQKEQNFNCIDSELNSIAKKNDFPQNDERKEEKKKLFMCKLESFISNDFISRKFEDTYINKLFLEKFIIEILRNIEIKIKKMTFNDDKKYKDYLNTNIGKYYNSYIIPNVIFIWMLILSSIESGDFIRFNHNIDWKKFWFNFSLGVLVNLFPKFRSPFFEIDFEKIFTKQNLEKLNMKNLFYKKKMKNVIKYKIVDNDKQKYRSDDIKNIIKNETNKIKNFSKYSEKQIMGKEYYESFLQIFNNYSNDFQEDIENSLYDNLKEENIFRENNISTIIGMMNNCIDDEESKKGFLALIKQSFLLGKLRTNVVSIYIK